CRHQCSTPSLAEPSPTTRPKGVRRLWGSSIRPFPTGSTASSRAPLHGAGDEGDDGQRRAARDHRPSAGIGRRQVEAMAGVPDEMANAVAEVKEQGEGPADEKQD